VTETILVSACADIIIIQGVNYMILYEDSLLALTSILISNPVCMVICVLQYQLHVIEN